MAYPQSSTRSDFYVYALFRDGTGIPFYIGKGSGDRWEHHERWARRGKRGHKYAIIRDMQARGVDIPKVKLHQRLTERVALAYELALIRAVGIGIHGPLVNLRETEGRPRGMKHSPESIARMSAAQIGKKCSDETRAKLVAAAAKHGKKPSAECIRAATGAKLGKKHSPERTAKHAATLRGRKYSEAHRAKISAALLGKKRSPERRENIGAGRRGKTFSAQHKANLSAVRRGKKWSPEARAKGMATRAANKLAKALL